MQTRKGIILNLDPDLAARLQRAADARRETARGLARELLERGLQQESRSSQARTILASLTPREQEVALLTLRGCTNREIAASLYISTETVKTHVRHVLEKFGATSKADLRLRLRRLDLGGSTRPS